MAAVAPPVEPRLAHVANLVHDLANALDALPPLEDNAVTLDAIRTLILESENRTQTFIQAAEARLTTAINNQALLLPIRLHNSKAPYEADLQYPAGVNGAGIARTKRDLYILPGPQCMNLANLLGIDIPVHMPHDQRRDRVIQYLGAV